jgi:hypothetical protein
MGEHECIECNFKTDKSCNYERHIRTKKHLDKVNPGNNVKKITTRSTLKEPEKESKKSNYPSDLIDNINKGFLIECGFPLDMKSSDIISSSKDDDMIILNVELKVFKKTIDKITVYIDYDYGYNILMNDRDTNEDIVEYFVFML